MRQMAQLGDTNGVMTTYTISAADRAADALSFLLA